MARERVAKPMGGEPLREACLLARPGDDVRDVVVGEALPVGLAEYVGALQMADALQRGDGLVGEGNEVGLIEFGGQLDYAADCSAWAALSNSAGQR